MASRRAVGPGALVDCAVSGSALRLAWRPVLRVVMAAVVVVVLLLSSGCGGAVVRAAGSDLTRGSRLTAHARAGRSRRGRSGWAWGRAGSLLPSRAAGEMGEPGLSSRGRSSWRHGSLEWPAPRDEDEEDEDDGNDGNDGNEKSWGCSTSRSRSGRAGGGDMDRAALGSNASCLTLALDETTGRSAVAARSGHRNPARRSSTQLAFGNRDF